MLHPLFMHLYFPSFTTICLGFWFFYASSFFFFYYYSELGYTNLYCRHRCFWSQFLLPTTSWLQSGRFELCSIWRTSPDAPRRQCVFLSVKSPTCLAMREFLELVPVVYDLVAASPSFLGVVENGLSRMIQTSSFRILWLQVLLSTAVVFAAFLLLRHSIFIIMN